MSGRTMMEAKCLLNGKSTSAGVSSEHAGKIFFKLLSSFALRD